MADISRITNPFVDGEVMSQAKFDVFVNKLNEVIDKVNQGDTPFDPTIEPTSDRSLQYWATLAKPTWIDTNDVLHIGNEEDASYLAYPTYSESPSSVKKVLGIGGRTDLTSFLRSRANLEEVYTRYWNMENVTTMNSMCLSTNKHIVLDTRLWNLANCTNFTKAFSTIHLDSLIGGIDESVDIDAQTDIVAMSGAKLSLDLSYSTTLTRPSLVALIRGLASVSTQQTLTLHATPKALLTDADKELLASKGWLLA